nr:cell wall protein IFF6-like [Procambarus clarkii]
MEAATAWRRQWHGGGSDSGGGGSGGGGSGSGGGSDSGGGNDSGGGGSGGGSGSGSGGGREESDDGDCIDVVVSQLSDANSDSDTEIVTGKGSRPKPAYIEGDTECIQVKYQSENENPLSDSTYAMKIAENIHSQIIPSS